MIDVSAYLPLDSSTILLILILTFLFDLIDLNPQVGSFSFLWGSSTYYIYFFLRYIFSIMAAIILQTTQAFQHAFLLAFFAVITSVSIIESFTLKIGGEELANLSGLFDTYRTKMISQELIRAGQRKMAGQMALVKNLADYCEKEALESSWLMCIRSLHIDDENLNQIVNDRKLDLEKIAGEDERTLKMLYASEIVNINPEYAEMLLPSRKS